MTRMTIRDGTAWNNSEKGRTLSDMHDQWCESRAEIVPRGGRTVYYTHDQYCACRTQVVGGGGTSVGYVWPMVWGHTPIVREVRVLYDTHDQLTEWDRTRGDSYYQSCFPY